MGGIIDGRVTTLERQTLNLHERMLRLEAQATVPAPIAADPARPIAVPPPSLADRAPTAERPPSPADRAPTADPPATSPSADPRDAWRARVPAGATVPPPRSGPASAPAGKAPARAPAARPGFDLEDLLGGRVLAWTGGIAVVAGIAFLLAIAVSRGWIGPGARTLLAGMLSVGLVAAGTRLYERAGRTDASLAALSAGIAGLFMTVVVGGPVYGVLPVAVALMLALATGALATAFAVRWASRGIGALGIVGALLSPVLAGAPSTGTTLAILWIATASAAAVLLWQRWNWLAIASFGITVPQWAWWLADQEPSTPAILLTLCAFGALNVAAAIGFELRVPATRLRAASALLLTANATVLALLGWFALDESGAAAIGRAWIGALAVAHLGVGLAMRSTRINRDIRLLSIALGVVLADVAAGLVLDGVVLAATWAATTAGFGLLARHVLTTTGDEYPGRDGTLLGFGLGGHLLLTTIQALMQAPPDTLAADQSVAYGGYVAIAATACAAFVAGRFVDDVRREWRVALDTVAMTAVAYLTAIALDGALLTAAFAAEAIALATIALRERDDVAAWGMWGFLGLAITYALTVVVWPNALITGLDDLPGAVLALGSTAAAALWGAHLAGRATRDVAPDGPLADQLARARAALGATGAVTLLFLASTALVTGFQPGDGTDAGLFDLGVAQLGQLLLSGLWAFTGVTALVIGLRRDDHALRLGALALLFVTVGKVFLYDLAALTSLYRVGSFIGLGLLLLFAAGLWQRMRPRPGADLRDVPPALR